MQTINFLLAAIGSYLGLAAGIILIHIAPEEQKSGKKYFIFLKYFFYSLIMLFLLYFNFNNLSFILLILVFLLVFLSLNKDRKKISEMNKSLVIYLILALVFFLSSKNLNLFIIESSLIFLYGIPNASLLTNLKKKNYGEILLKHVLFLIILFIL